MAGHSKWANIKFRKAAQDAKKGKLFTKLIREITVAARNGGGDAMTNPRLRTAVDKALSANMTRETIDRAIKRGTGELDGVSYEEIRYEGYASAGVAVLVDCTTDNRNRTVGEIRHAFSKFGGNLGTEGSVSYIFSKKGLLIFSSEEKEERVMDVAVEAGAEEIQSLPDGSIEVLTQPENFDAVNTAVKDAGLQTELAQIIQKPASESEVKGSDAENVSKLIDTLEEMDDVQEVYTNAVFLDESVTAG